MKSDNSYPVILSIGKIISIKKRMLWPPRLRTYHLSLRRNAQSVKKKIKMPSALHPTLNHRPILLTLIGMSSCRPLRTANCGRLQVASKKMPTILAWYVIISNLFILEQRRKLSLFNMDFWTGLKESFLIFCAREVFS